MFSTVSLMISILIVVLLASSAISTERKRCRHINHQKSDEINCTNINACRKTFNISYIKIEPYSPNNGVENYIDLCCRPCSRTKVLNTFNDSSSLTPDLISTSHFIYPFLGGATDQFVNGYYFIPVMNAPKTYYLTLKPERTIFQSLFQLYPLLTVCFFMGILAGFICWVIECRLTNEISTFTNSFFIGWFEGIWWAFVSMSSVGYGDFTPRTTIGRLFSIIWILLGTTTLTVFTAMLTAVLTETNTLKQPKVYASKVGVLRGRLYDALVVTDHGGIVKQSATTEFELSLQELIAKIHNKTIDGILLDSYTLLYIELGLNVRRNENIKESLRKEKIRSDLKNLIKTCIVYDNEVLAYGILVKLEEDYEFFRDVIRGNRLNLQMSLDQSLNQAINHSMSQHSTELFAPDKAYFQKVATFLFVINGMILIVGCLYGYAKWKRYETRKKLLEKFDNCMV